MTKIQATIKELETRIAKTERELETLKIAAETLRKLDDGAAAPVKTPPAPKKRGISRAGRARIAAAQKARWAKIKAAKGAAKPKAKRVASGAKAKRAAKTPPTDAMPKA